MYFSSSKVSVNLKINLIQNRGKHYGLGKFLRLKFLKSIDIFKSFLAKQNKARLDD
jgi:hypothetical protein